MDIEETFDKKKHTRRVLNGFYVVVALGVGIFFVLLNIISRGGWFILLSILLGIFLLCIILYVIAILCSLFLLKQPETVVLDEKGLEERSRLKKQKEEEKGEGEGVHIRFGRRGN